MSITSQNRRVSERLPIKFTVVLSHPRSARRIKAGLLDISERGCQISSEEPLRVGSQLFIQLNGLETWPATITWKGVRSFGLEFHRPMHVSVVEHYARKFPVREG